MSDVFNILSSLEKDEHLHLGRILLLIYVFGGESHLGQIEGLTKLAKLDFLLRYPVYLEKALAKQNKKMNKSEPKHYERQSVEAKMVRFKYGPWDFRYRRFINTLVSRDLVSLRKSGRSYCLGITMDGVNVAKALAEDELLLDTIERAKLIKSNFNISGTNLMRFIYKTFPEIGSLQYGKEIL